MSNEEAIQNSYPSRIGSGKEGHPMRPTDELGREVQVERDPAGASVELKIAATAGHDPHVIHLSRDEARHLAALILFLAERLERDRKGWRLTDATLARRTA
jgi:hypothetical protein